jgi:iron complex outermembrane receptor protein
MTAVSHATASRCTLLAASVTAALLSCAAQAEAPSAGQLEEIVVTATKHAQTISDTAAAITAISADKLGPGGIQNVYDLSSAVPNLSIGNQFGVNRAFIRGVGMTSIDLGADGAVAFLQNGAQIARPAEQLTGFYDLEQVEVLRGPQGTTYGRGATAGVVNLVTKKPTDKLEGYADLTYGNYSSKIVEGAIGGPLSDRVSVRLAGKWEKHDGYGTNLFTGNPVDDRDAYAFRGSLRIKASDSVLIDIVADAGLHYDPSRLRGSVFHLLGCLSEYGKLGMTCVGGSDREAAAVYEATAAELLRGGQARQSVLIR